MDGQIILIMWEYIIVKIILDSYWFFVVRSRYDYLS